MAKKLYPEESIQLIASAIRTKNGSATPYKVAEMPLAILDITSENYVDYLMIVDSNVGDDFKWHKPQDWPDIESIEIAETASELYLLYGNHLNGASFCRLRVYGSGLQWAKGEVIEGTFKEDSWMSISSGSYIYLDLEKEERDYTVIGIRGTTITLVSALAASGTPAYSSYLNTCLMRYGNLPKATYIPFPVYYLQSDNVKNFAAGLTNTALTVTGAYSGCRSLQRWRNTGWNIAGNYTTSLANVFNSCTSLIDTEDVINFDYWCGPKTTSITGFMTNAMSISKISVVGWDLSVVTNCSSAFSTCYRLQSIRGLDSWGKAPKCTTVASMFYCCYNLSTPIELPYLVTSTCTNTSTSFYYCYAVRAIDISNWDFTRTTTCSQMFYYCQSLKKLLIDSILPPTSVNTNLTQMFYGCRSLPYLYIKEWDFTKATMVGFMGMCSGVKTVTFKDCKPNATAYSESSSTGNLFSYLFSCETLDVSNLDWGKWSSSYAHSVGFRYNYKLIDFYPPLNICKAFTISDSQLLSKDSLLRILNNLSTVSSSTKLTLGSVNLAKLTADEKAIATGKGWTLA